ncbi:MAG: SPOR domain-containing protein [Taibaiella sp.]|nr:SPOR domain-containing protein [Taibaiella sp.]
MKWLCLLVFLFYFPYSGYGQVKVSYNDDHSDTTGVVLHADPRIALLLQQKKEIIKVSTGGTGVITGSIYSGHGFRVQIYSGNERAKAINVKLDFMRRFPGVRTYMSYHSPQFRVKVGDYKSRAEAANMYREVNELYNPCMIVPDIVVINTFRND